MKKWLALMLGILWMAMCTAPALAGEVSSANGKYFNPNRLKSNHDIASGLLAGMTLTNEQSDKLERLAAIAERVEVPTEFSIRDGITWNSTKKDILIREEIPLEDFVYMNGIIGFEGEGLSVSNYDAYVTYAFKGENLVSVLYFTGYLPKSDLDYLTEALTSKYGMPIASDAVRLFRLSELIDGVPMNHAENLTCWTIEDGTFIAIFTKYPYGRAASNSEQVIQIFYINEPVLLDAGNPYNIDGL